MCHIRRSSDAVNAVGIVSSSTSSSSIGGWSESGPKTPAAVKGAGTIEPARWRAACPTCLAPTPTIWSACISEPRRAIGAIRVDRDEAERRSVAAR